MNDDKIEIMRAVRQLADTTSARLNEIKGVFEVIAKNFEILNECTTLTMQRVAELEKVIIGLKEDKNDGKRNSQEEKKVRRKMSEKYKPLLPCPFCGGVAIVVPAAVVGIWRVVCADRMGCTVAPATHAPTVEEAAEKWNTRKVAK